jgi:hypothetical protein
VTFIFNFLSTEPDFCLLRSHLGRRRKGENEGKRLRTTGLRDHGTTGPRTTPQRAGDLRNSPTLSSTLSPELPMPTWFLHFEGPRDHGPRDHGPRDHFRVFSVFVVPPQFPPFPMPFLFRIPRFHLPVVPGVSFSARASRIREIREIRGSTSNFSLSACQLVSFSAFRATARRPVAFPASPYPSTTCTNLKRIV